MAMRLSGDRRQPVKIGGAGYNNLAAGNRTYGTGRPFPNMGATSNKLGYAKRDAMAKARREALLDRLKGRDI